MTEAWNEARHKAIMAAFRAAFTAQSADGFAAAPTASRQARAREVARVVCGHYPDGMGAEALCTELAEALLHIRGCDAEFAALMLAHVRIMGPLLSMHRVELQDKQAGPAVGGFAQTVQLVDKDGKPQVDKHGTPLEFQVCARTV